MQLLPDPPISEDRSIDPFLKDERRGAIAQLGERLLCKQEVVGSIPSGSTKHLPVYKSADLVRTFLSRQRFGIVL